MDEDKLKALATDVYLESRATGNIPDEVADYGYMSDEEIEMYANENEMTVPEYNVYLEYLVSLFND